MRAPFRPKPEYAGSPRTRHWPRAGHRPPVAALGPLPRVLCSLCSPSVCSLFYWQESVLLRSPERRLPGRRQGRNRRSRVRRRESLSGLVPLRLRFRWRRWLLFRLGLGRCFLRQSALLFLGLGRCLLRQSALLFLGLGRGFLRQSAPLFRLGLGRCFLRQSALLFLGLPRGFLRQSAPLFRLGLGRCFLRQSALLFLGLGRRFLRQSAPLLSLRSLTFGKRRTTPSAEGVRAVARKTGAQSGNPRTPLVGLADQVASQGHSGMARGYNLVSQPHRRFG